MRVRVVSGLLAVVLAADLVAVVAHHRAGEPRQDVAAAAVAIARTAPAPVDPILRLEPMPVVTVLAGPRATTGPVVLPVPEAPPVDPHAPTPEVRHGTIEIPAIGVSDVLYEGVTLTSINRGPSHWPGTAMPGEPGNVVVAGHRTTYSKPFGDLDLLGAGDELIFTTAAGRFVYVLDRVHVVDDEDMSIIIQTSERRVTLFACHPKGSARQRIVAEFAMRPVPVAVPVGDWLRSLAPAE